MRELLGVEDILRIYVELRHSSSMRLIRMAIGEYHLYCDFRAFNASVKDVVEETIFEG